MKKNLFEQLDEQFSPRKPRLDHKRFVVMERGYTGERIVYESDNEEAAKHVASQHGARRVVAH